MTRARNQSYNKVSLKNTYANYNTIQSRTKFMNCVSDSQSSESFIESFYTNFYNIVSWSEK